jgi:hypothetical protein
VLHGKSFRFTPAPPALDQLPRPLVVRDLRLDEILIESRRSRFDRFLDRNRLRQPSRDQRLRWRILDAAAHLFTKVGGVDPRVRPPPPDPSAAAGKKAAKGPGRGAGRSAALSLASDLLHDTVPGAAHPVDLRHLYEVRPVFELLPDLPAAFEAERNALSAALTVVVQAYLVQINKTRQEPLVFHQESQDYFYIGYKLEKMLVKIEGKEERFAGCQHVYDNYYHGMSYYIYSLFALEKMPIDNQLFMYFCNAAYFMARIDWSGALTERPSGKTLPNRNRVLFYALRDASVLHQFKNNPEYAFQLRDMLRAFPSG